MAARKDDGRRGRRALGTAVAAVAAVVLAGCGAFGSGAPETITQTVTAAPSPSDEGSAAGDRTPSSGPPVTVVAPNALQSGSDTAPETPSDTAAAETTDPETAAAETTGLETTTAPVTTTMTATTAVTTDQEARAVARKIATTCGVVLNRGDITGVFGATAISDESLRTDEAANPDNQMTARSKCYYGTSDLAVARPLVVALAGFETPEAAARQVAVTTDSEKAAGAKASQVEVGGQTVQLLLRDGGLAMVQSGALTISIAVANGIADDAKLAAGLPTLVGAVLGHLR